MMTRYSFPMALMLGVVLAPACSDDSEDGGTAGGAGGAAGAGVPTGVAGTLGLAGAIPSAGAAGSEESAAELVSCEGNPVAVTVQISAGEFVPESPNAGIGDVVKFENQDEEVHSVVSGQNASPDGLWDTGELQPGDSACVLFRGGGTYYYYCGAHPDNAAQVEIKPLI